MFLKLGRDYVLVTCTHMMSIYNNNSNSMVLHVQNIRRDKSSHALLICQFLTYKASFGFNSFNLREQIQGIWILSIHFPLHLSPSDIWTVDCIKWSKKSRNSDNKMKLRHVLFWTVRYKTKGLKLRWRKMEREINIEDSNWLMRLDIWSIHQHFQSKLFYFLIYHVSLTLGTCCVICCTCCVIFFTYFRRYIKYSHPCHHCLQKWHIYKI